MTAPLTCSFSAINGPQVQLCTPPQSSAAISDQHRQAHRRVAITKRRRRNPTVAQYLGLGPSSESNQVEQNVSASNCTRNRSASASKRRKLGNKNDATHQQFQSVNEDCSLQSRIWGSLRVTKVRHSSVTSSKPNPDDTESSWVAPEQDTAAQSPLSQSRPLSEDVSRLPHGSTAMQGSAVTYVGDSLEATSWSHTQVDCSMTPTHANEIRSEHDTFHQTGGIDSGDNEWTFDEDEEDFNDDLNDEEFLELTSQIADLHGDIANSPSSSCHSDSTHTVYVDDECPRSAPKRGAPSKKDLVESQRSSKKFVSPMTLTSRLLASTGDIDRTEARKPIARSPFPDAVRDRSPIIGLSSDTCLRTCFRVGEAINQAYQSSKNGKHMVLELYAKIFESSRDDVKQHFTFCDLFHGKPPYVKGIYEGARWQSAQLFYYDSRRLLQQGRICRCMGTMKRDGKEWVMHVSSIWEATWDDIKWVEGIVDA